MLEMGDDMFETFTCDTSSNIVNVGQNIEVVGEIVGTDNVIEIAATRMPTKIMLTIYGNGNRVSIGSQSLLSNVRVDIGSKKWKASQTKLEIGELFSIASRGRFILPNSGNIVRIGDRCMFSNGVTIRAGEYPHLLFDIATGEYLDISEGIFIGNHVWVGENVFISKAATIGNECVVGTRSVVTKRFEIENAVIAGSPARVVREGVQWVMNEKQLSEFSRFKNAYEQSQVSQINKANAKA